MAVIKVVTIALAAIFLVALSVKQVDCQKCKTKWNTSFSWTVDLVDYIVPYNISDTKTDVTCFDVFDNFHGSTDNTATFVYKRGGVSVKREAEFKLDPDNQLNLIYKDSPNVKINVYAEQGGPGIGVLHFCAPTGNYILIGYDGTKPELAAVCDELAKGLTDKNTADFKISRDNC